MRVFKELLLASFAYLLLCMLLFPTVFFGKEAFFFADNYSLMVPQKIFLTQQLKQGIIPFWNPFIHSGTPAFADVSYAIFYPSTLLFFVLNSATAVNTTIILHLVFTALGVFAAARVMKQKMIFALISGVVWMLSESVLTVTSNLTILQSTSWLPWLLILHIKSLANRRWLLLQPLVISLAFLGGHPQTLAYYVFAYTIFVLIAKRELSYLKSYFLSLGALIPLLLFILIPFKEISTLSTRDMSSFSEKMAGSIHPALLVHWIVPHVFSDPASGMVWGPEWGRMRSIAGYSTIALLSGFGLFLFSKQKTKEEKFLYVLALGSVVFMLGKYLPWWQSYQFVPGINVFRNHAAAAAVLWSLAISVLAGQSIHALASFIQKYKLVVILVVLFALAAVVTRISVTFLNPDLWQKLHLSGFHTYERDVVILTTMSMSALVTVICLLIIMLVLKFNMPLWIVLFVIVADLSFAHRPIVFIAPQSIYDQQSPQAVWLKNNMKPGFRTISSSSYLAYTGLPDYWNNIFIRPPFGESRFTDTESRSFSELIARQHNLAADWNEVYNVPLANGYATFVLKDTANYWEHDPIYTPINDVDKVPFDDRRLNEQGVKYITVDKTVFENRKIPAELSKFQVIKEEKDWAILENPYALPYVRTNGRIQLLNSTVNEIKFISNTVESTDIFIAAAHYPGWKCEVDGKECEIQNDGMGMKVRTTQGEHHYTLSFTPTGWPLLGYLSLLSWFLYLVFIYKNFLSKQS